MASLSLFSQEQLLTALGVLIVLWLSLKAAWGLAQALRTYVLSEAWKGIDLASYGPWAVVTGATAGIGKAYAHELARRGLNVVLISRSMEKLKQVAAEIAEQYGRGTKVIQADFTQGSEIYEKIEGALQGLEIGILVNNVGQSITRLVNFLDVDDIDKYITDLVHCNMLSTVKMTQIILPQMVARKKGIVINMSSAAGQRPMPFASMYCSTKVFDDFFSQALDMEYRSKGIIVQNYSLLQPEQSYLLFMATNQTFSSKLRITFLLKATLAVGNPPFFENTRQIQSVQPMFVESSLTREIRRSYKIPAKVFARQALNTVGLSNRTCGCLNHSIQSNVMSVLFPEALHSSSAGMNVIQFLWKSASKPSK